MNTRLKELLPTNASCTQPVVVHNILKDPILMELHDPVLHKLYIW